MQTSLLLLYLTYVLLLIYNFMVSFDLDDNRVSLSSIERLSILKAYIMTVVKIEQLEIK